MASNIRATGTLNFFDLLPMSSELRPERLTAELVMHNFERVLRHRIQQFKVTEPVDDCLQQLLLAMITPSKTLGTSYLERYNPSRGPALNYVMMFCTQQMMKLHAKEKLRRHLLLDAVRLVHDLPSDGDSDAPTDNEVLESHLADESWSLDFLESAVQRPEDLRALLGDTPHARAHSSSPAGEPRSTLHMLELYLWEGLTMAEIAVRLAVTSSEVQRRFKNLRKEPRLSPLFPAST